MSERKAYAEKLAREKLAQVMASSSITINVEDAAVILCSAPQDIRWQAQQDPAKLGFPVIVHRARIKIPRLGFIHYIQYGRALPQEALGKDAL